MIIYPQNFDTPTFADVVTGLNTEPAVGDAGHVEDHGRLAQVLFGVHNVNIVLGVAARSEGQWTFMANQVDPPQNVTFAKVRELAERPGVAVTASSDLPYADGVTDHREDSEEFEGPGLYLVASGVVGLSYAVEALTEQVMALQEG